MFTNVVRADLLVAFLQNAWIGATGLKVITGSIERQEQVALSDRYALVRQHPDNLFTFPIRPQSFRWVLNRSKSIKGRRLGMTLTHESNAAFFQP